MNANIYYLFKSVFSVSLYIPEDSSHKESHDEFFSIFLSRSGLLLIFQIQMPK